MLAACSEAGAWGLCSGNVEGQGRPKTSAHGCARSGSRGRAPAAALHRKNSPKTFLAWQIVKTYNVRLSNYHKTVAYAAACRTYHGLQIRLAHHGTRRQHARKARRGL